MRDVLIIAATRKSRTQFERSSYLGQSLCRLAFDPRVSSAITYDNRGGLPAIFNRQLAKKNKARILVFTHDDTRIDDYWLSRRLDEGLRVFDVLGVAGNRRRMPKQTGWAFDDKMKWDKRENLSGAVCHECATGEEVSYFGEPCRRCKLLDGVLIAVKVSTLLDCGLRFDERFAFHFYDLDFCRSAERYGLTLGTWPIAITHASGGSFNSTPWKRALKLYRAKWEN